MLFHAAPCWFIVSHGFRTQGPRLLGSSTEEALSRGAERRAGDFVYPQQVSSDHVPPGLLPCSSHHMFVHPSIEQDWAHWGQRTACSRGLARPCFTGEAEGGTAVHCGCGTHIPILIRLCSSPQHWILVSPRLLVIYLVVPSSSPPYACQLAFFIQSSHTVDLKLAGAGGWWSLSRQSSHAFQLRWWCPLVATATTGGIYDGKQFAFQEGEKHYDLLIYAYYMLLQS